MYGGVLEPDGEIGADVLPFVYRWSSAPQVPRIVMPTPVCRVENFLGTERADALLSYAVSRQAAFTAGTVMDPLTGVLSYKDRDSLVLPVHGAVFHWGTSVFAFVAELKVSA